MGDDENQGVKILIVVVGLIIIIIFAAVIGLDEKIPGLSKLKESPNPYEKVYVEYTYEVTHVYRMYDGSHMPYAVDYITDDGTTKTLIAFNEGYAKNVITIHPNSDKTCLVHNETWYFYESGHKRVFDSKFNYHLYLTNDTVIMGVPTHYSRSRASDFDSTIIVIK